MCEIYLQTKTLISSLGSDYKASHNGDGVRVECHRYIYHRIMDTIMSPSCALPANQGTDMFNVKGMRVLFFWFHEMLFDELWSSNWHLGSTLRKETRAEFTILEQSRKWPILRGFYWAVNEASGPEIKYQPAFYYWAQVTNMWWVQDGSGIRSGMSGGCQDDVSLLVIMSTEIDSSIIFNN